MYLIIHYSDFYSEFKLDVLVNTNEELPRLVDHALKYAICPLIAVFLLAGAYQLVIYIYSYILFNIHYSFTHII